MSDRYQIEHDAEHTCCNVCSVVDTDKKMLMSNGEWYMGRYERLCECQTEEDAQLIVDCLNLISKANPHSEKVE